MATELILSEHFTIGEATLSATADQLKVRNYPDTNQFNNMRVTAAYMEIVRGILGTPISINSWFRCLEVNRALKSKDTSQHRTGEAVDFVSPGFGSPLAICKKLISMQSILPYDQLILEHTWVHISFSVISAKPKRQVLSLLDSGNYSVGLTDKKGKPL